MTQTNINVTNTNESINISDFRFTQNEIFSQVSEYLKTQWSENGECVVDINSLEYKETELLCLEPEDSAIGNVFQVFHTFRVDVVDMEVWAYEFGDDVSDEMWIMVSGGAFYTHQSQNSVASRVFDGELSHKSQLVQFAGDRALPMSVEDFWNHFD